MRDPDCASAFALRASANLKPAVARGASGRRALHPSAGIVGRCRRRRGRGLVHLLGRCLDFITGAQLAQRTGLSVGVSVGLATLFQMKHPLYAAIAAIIVTDLSPSRSRHLGLHRIIATVVGSICAVFAVHSCHPRHGPWVWALPQRCSYPMSCKARMG